MAILQIFQVQIPQSISKSLNSPKPGPRKKGITSHPVRLTSQNNSFHTWCEEITCFAACDREPCKTDGEYGTALTERSGARGMDCS